MSDLSKADTVCRDCESRYHGDDVRIGELVRARRCLEQGRVDNAIRLLDQVVEGMVDERIES
jgi:hypothetical protein